ncbi:MAG: 50S ribosomal protein L3 [Candidatus Zophobacter franzmannii]|nr:50S ribosomal protein L3 [Candidatus Zophobacter franzmannii]
MVGLIGKKIGMTQVFTEDGKVVPVTLIQAGPCRVVNTKSLERDGYIAIQLGFEKLKDKKLNKPMAGYFKKFDSQAFRYLHEFRLKTLEDIELQDEFRVDLFQENEIVDVVGTSKGRGFAGVMKRHNFHGFKASHGVHESYRGGGSIGQCATPARVHKGKKMPGHYGVDRVTLQNLRVVKVDVENSLIMVKGAIPGHRNSIVYIKKAK